LEVNKTAKSKLLQCEEKCMDYCRGFEKEEEDYMRCMGECMANCADVTEAARVIGRRG